MRAAITATTICLSVNGYSQTNAPTASRRETHIPAEDLGSALRALDRKSVV